MNSQASVFITTLIFGVYFLYTASKPETYDRLLEKETEEKAMKMIKRNKKFAIGTIVFSIVMIIICLIPID